MNRSYILKHWMGTILLGTMLLVISPGSNLSNSFNIYQIILVSIYVLCYSAIYSIPTLLCYILAFYWLRNNTLNVNWIKMTFILITIAGITMTMALTKGSIEFAAYYSIPAIVTGILFKIEKI